MLAIDSPTGVGISAETSMGTRSFLVVLTLSTTFVACKGGGGDGECAAQHTGAELEVSTEFIEFGLQTQGERVVKTVTISNPGDLPLGIKNIYLISSVKETRGDKGSFSDFVEVADMIIPSGGSAEGTRRPVPNDSGGGGDTSGEIDTADTDGTDPVPSEENQCGDGTGFLFCLPPGARIPVTISFSPDQPRDNYDSLVIESADAPELEGSTTPWALPHRDTDNRWRQVYLHGTGAETVANAVVSPRSVDFGLVWADDPQIQYIAVKNLGEGNLTYKGYQVSEDCSDGFEVTFAPPTNTVIEGATSSVIEVTYTAPDNAVEEARCKVTVTTDDLDTPEQVVELVANSGRNPDNKSPIVEILSPKPGYQHQGFGPINMELVVRDPDQPANTLTCKVGSVIQVPALLANCKPSDEAGHVFVSVPIVDILDAGLEVLTVTVTDQSEIRRRASVPILINANYPPDDNDGDGFGKNDETWKDCDDNNIASYPYAAEVADEKDNDCDFKVDEETDNADDDGDGLPEVGGDCDDNNPDTYSGAPEILDGADNDCDGIRDENTSAYDDDGDGFTELDLDCNDTSIVVNPGSPEICGDGLDNNCNGLKDSAEPCVEVDSKPRIIGLVNPTQTDIEFEEATQVNVLVSEPDGDALTYQWSSANAIGTIDNPAAPTITWTAPASKDLPLEKGQDGAYVKLSVIVVDPDGFQDWDFTEIGVYKTGSLKAPICEPAQ